jgi:putative RNA 2'-phosphotransferase
MKNELVRISKIMSKHLRHEPEALGLQLELGGWVLIHDLLNGLAKKGFRISREALLEVVRDNDKQRFSFDETGLKIRANQGHSTTVDLQLEPAEPPAVLYHGTNEAAVASILESGLQRMSRHHVHLSPDLETARRVGMRKGRVVIFKVDAALMHSEDIAFYRSDNGVWLVDEVAARFIRPLE